MIKRKYEIDDNNEIIVGRGLFGGDEILVNGNKISEKVKLKNKKPFNFNLEDGRSVEVTFRQLAFAPEFELKVDGLLMLEASKDTLKRCTSCSSENKPNDKFCVKCGAELP